MGHRKLNNNVLKPDPYYSELHATFGDRLCAARDAAGLTQKVLANKIGVKVKTKKSFAPCPQRPNAPINIMRSEPQFLANGEFSSAIFTSFTMAARSANALNEGNGGKESCQPES